MEKILKIIPLVLFVLSCSHPKNNQDNKPENNLNVAKVSVDIFDVSHVDLSEVFKKIDLIPLETKDESLVGGITQLIYVKDDYFIIRSGDRNVIIFDNVGNFISNSLAKRGNGPGEYIHIFCAAYNPFKKTIDILQPQNKITSYDVLFNFVSENKINHQRKNYGMFHYIFPIGEMEYMCLNLDIYDDFDKIFFYDTKREEIVKTITFEDIYCGFTQEESPFYLSDSTYYFAPPLTTYSGYSVDIDNRTLDKKIYLDFGRKKINLKTIKQYEENEDIASYLLTSNIPTPDKNLFNNNYVISRILVPEKVEMYTFFCNLTTGQKYMLKEKTKDNYSIPDFHILEDSVLYAAIHAYHISEYIDPDLLSDSAKDILRKIKEEDNPIIVKYYLK